MKIACLKITLLFLLFSLQALQVKIQAQIGAWKVHRAYQNATIVIETPRLVFAVYDGSLMSYNPEDEEVKTYFFKEGLNDVAIQHMVYSPEANALILAYENANIDIFVKENEVYNLSFIKDDNNIQDKTVYNLEMIGSYAYLSTAFGIVVIDTQRKEIKDTYRLGSMVKSVCQKDNYLYAATSDGLKRASLSSNLPDRENWEKPDWANSAGSFEYVVKLSVFKDHLFFHYSWGSVHYFIEDNSSSHTYLTDQIRQMTLLNDRLILLAPDAIYFYSDLDTKIQIPIGARAIDCNNSKNRYWLCLNEQGGLAGITKQADSSEYTTIISGLQINSPKRNINFYMTHTANKLLVVGGGRKENRFDLEGTLMVYENGQWFNLDENSVSRETGLPCLDFTSVAVDPRDPNHYFVGSYGEGLYEFQDNKFVRLYSLQNSSLQTAGPGSLPERYVRVDGLAFDKNNNLYMANVMVQNGLSRMTPQHEWQSFYSPPISASDLNALVLDRYNQIWMNIWRTDKGGIVVIDGKNADSSSDNSYAYSRRFVDQMGTDIKAANYLCMAEDLNGIIWVGTDNGPISFSSAEQVRRGECYRTTGTDQYGNAYYILENQKITTIAVDGGNRKWVGTDNSGIFVVDQSDPSNIVIENYTTDNSLLISNKINTIAIDNETGEVFIGTDKGICSYMSDAISGRADYSEVYAFPNPVYPDRNGQVIVTGFIANSTVKITDLTGNLIKEGKSMGGQFTWNCTDRRGAIVKAGIYLVFASTPSGSESVVTKIMVIR